jgi:DNA-binding MarR family transcriptional regulator
MPSRKKPLEEEYTELLSRLFPDPRGLHAWSAFLRAHATLMRELDTRLQEDSGCTLADFDCLSQIGGVGGSLRMTELANRLLVSRSGLTRRIARLEDEGLVQRAPADDDGRGVVVQITAAGAKMMLEATRSHARDVKRLFVSQLDDREAAIIERALSRVIVDCNFG